MAGRLAALPEAGTTGAMAPSPQRNLYLDSIRCVAASGGRIVSIAVHSGLSCSVDSSSAPSDSYASKVTASSAGSPCAAAAELGAHELTKIGRRMISDGYTRRMALEYSGGSDGALETLFSELDVDWVLQIPEGRGSRRQLQLNDLAERWVRAFIVILTCIVEEQPSSPSARFGKASINKMLVFVDAVVSPQEEKTLSLRDLLDMYICVSSAAYNLTGTLSLSPGVQHIYSGIACSLSREGDKLNRAMYSRMEEVWALMENDDSWAFEIRRGGGKVHPNTQLMVDCILSIVEALGWAGNYAWFQDTTNLRRLIDENVHYLKEFLLRKSVLCSDPTLRYLFLLNNSYLVAQLFELRPGDHWGLTPQCEKYMDGYLDVSWRPVLSHIPQMAFMEGYQDVPRGHVMFCIPKTFLHTPFQRLMKTTSPLAKFDSAFRKAYQAQKFLNVPDPWLRSVLRETITKRIISRYRDYLAYLKNHPELEKHVSHRCSSTNQLREMLGELFEG